MKSKLKRPPRASWARFQELYRDFPSIELALDLSRMNVNAAYFKRMERPMQRAFKAMRALERGAIANPDERRMVGHYWLRNPALAPTKAIRQAIESNVKQVKTFAAKVHSGKIRGAGGRFNQLLIIGIGGSALGPQFVSQALGHPKTDRLRLKFFDNTDPDGMERVIAEIGNSLGRTLCIVISKSGGTKETRNGMLEAKAAYERHGLVFERHAVAITGQGSDLDKYARKFGWIKRFPMWDWVGGRTSELSAVGLLPAALQGIGVSELLRGARQCDSLTRSNVTSQNPAALLALAWFKAVNGKGEKNMVVLPYKDRLELLSKYLQQLIMESLGKEKDLKGMVVHQGITVLGNKGSTDQHSYIQQLRDGLDDFFATFVEVLADTRKPSLFVEPDVTSGDYLNGFLLGTRQALHEAGRESLSIIVNDVTAFSIGVLISLFERAVGFYASLINVNAYHQPGVEAGKKAAAAILALQGEVINVLRANRKKRLSSVEIASQLKTRSQVELIFKICQRLSANPWRRIAKHRTSDSFTTKFSVV